MRKLTGLAVIIGVVALAVVIGQRMSTDAMAIIVGVVFGVAASIPTSLLVIAATRSAGGRDAAMFGGGHVPQPGQAAPTVNVYINGAPAQSDPGWAALPPAREFIGLNGYDSNSNGVTGLIVGSEDWED